MWTKLIQKNRARFLKIPKRVRYVLASGVGGLSLFFLVGLPYQYTGIALPFLILLSYALTWFALLEDIKGVEWGTLFILPVFWTVCWYLSFYMLSMRFLIRLLFGLTYPVIFYVLVSAMNIFNVGVEKNLQLRRAAHAANSFIMVFTYYLFVQVLHSFAFPWYVVTFLVGVATFALGVQYFWTLSPSPVLSQSVWSLAAYQAFVMMFTNILISFLPFAAETTRPVIISGVYYVVGGLLEAHTDEVLLRQKVREYTPILVMLLLAIFLTLR